MRLAICHRHLFELCWEENMRQLLCVGSHLLLPGHFSVDAGTLWQVGEEVSAPVIASICLPRGLLEELHIQASIKQRDSPPPPEYAHF